MQLKLRSKHGGRLEVLDENGQAVDGVVSIELHAGAPDFVPMVRIVLRAAVAADVKAEIAVRNGLITGKKPALSGPIGDESSVDITT